MSRRRYTSTDKSTVLKWIQLYPDNVLHATEKAAEELGRTIGSVRNKYYTCWRLDEDFQAITVGSKEGFTHNVKNTLRADGVFPENRALNTVEWLMRQFLELTVDERNTIFNFFISTGTINVANPVNKVKGNNNKITNNGNQSS